MFTSWSSLMNIALFGRGLTIWSMIIATMVTLSQPLGNAIVTIINQSVHFFFQFGHLWEFEGWISLLNIFSFSDIRSWLERWWRPGDPSSSLFVNGIANPTYSQLSMFIWNYFFSIIIYDNSSLALICRGDLHPALWGDKLGNSWRTTNDINDSWERYRFKEDFA